MKTLGIAATISLREVSHCLKTSVAGAYVADWSHRPINGCVNIHTVSSIKLRHFEVQMCIEIPQKRSSAPNCNTRYHG
jgi:hypothetical protein